MKELVGVVFEDGLSSPRSRPQAEKNTRVCTISAVTLSSCDLMHAREIIEDWRRDYNEVRPHSSLNHQTPKEYALAAAGL